MKPDLTRRRLLSGIVVGGGFGLASRQGYSDDGDALATENASNSEVSSGPVEATFERDYEAPDFRPSWKRRQINRTLAADFVIYAHSDLKMTEKLLDREGGLIHAAIDWGGGDYETALGGASHMGRRDIVEMLLSRGARPDLHCMAMLGNLEAVRSMLTLQPALIDSKGPHGFSLHFHAQVGGDDADPVLQYLQSIKKVELRPVPFLNKK